MFDIIGFGALNVDLIYDVDGRLKTKSGGGQAANTVVVLSRMGFNCGYIGKVGTDSEGDFLIESLAKEGVDVSQIKREGKSGIAEINLDENGERSISVSPEANDLLTYEEINISYIENTRFLHLSSFLGKSPFQAQEKITQELSERINISLDPDIIYAQKGLDKLLPLLKEVFLVFPNQEELEVMTAKSYQKGAKELLVCGVEVVACKRGRKGCHIFTQEEDFTVAGESVKVSDTTGAGDVFAAGFLAGILMKKGLRKSAQLATKLAARSITGFGRENYPDEKFLKDIVT